MAVPWLVVGQLVLSNLDKIIAVVKPGFTRKRAADAPAPGGAAPADLVSQQIAELQTAAALNSDQIAALAIQLKDVVAALEQAGQEAARQRALAKRMAVVAIGIAFVALCAAIASLIIR
jgi:hypothetical protein